MYLIHESGKKFPTEYKNTHREMVSAHISNYFNSNKMTNKGNLDTQFGFIIDRMIKNLDICDSYNEAREKTINEFEFQN